jgi:hypothetical protein
MCTVFGGVFSSMDANESMWRTFWSRNWGQEDYWGLIFEKLPDFRGEDDSTFDPAVFDNLHLLEDEDD